WVLAACLLSLFGDAAGLLTAIRGVNNQWLSYLVTPLLGATMLGALAEWQPTEAERTGVRTTAVLLLVTSLVLALVVEDRGNFSRFALPLAALLVLAGAVYTLVRRGASGERSELVRQDWFWVGAGFAVYGMVTAAYFPLLAVLTPIDVTFVGAVLQFKAIMVLLAFGLVGWGVACRTSDRSSGRFSLS
ncbi:MAG: hypothetical protein ABR602_14370, partial [Gemmatimonadales bacterium]